ncbi:putative ATP-dependent DEAD/H RNA helicase [Leptomonas pyrrhocoris]|uniref:Putative ATP-dependent DEAD/H RNA helicase n=1 Tax=Leptomonas pyrrhocoris TaxID=157538 RepID=A0A0N0DZV6_LEPPY|nr:putative ATP-dependent DEAD/H RNA helicase [Leptomonas pyrrhocoris]KPA85725.1 putative ATP-dependent DEAD/H RNA helicase [Leptomonas pyrrhocoris]|eukprot:XP_015664164.1 putative ATP-dependent DEAD/H RNA helicase [Leptomonas pyrrhocoris]
MTHFASGEWNFHQYTNDGAADAASVALPGTVAPNTVRCPAPRQSLDCEGAQNEVLNRVSNEHAQQLRCIYAKLYPYQRELFRVSALQDSLVYLQTGGGKTWVAAALISLHLAMHPTSRVFFLVRTVALAAQQAKVLERLTGVTVACVAGGAKEFRTVEAFCQAPRCRVAVIIDTRFFEWLSAAPTLVTEQLASLVLLDEAHHAQGGAYQRICEQLHTLRDGKARQVTVESMCHLDDATLRERLHIVGLRSAAATVLASRLQRAHEQERRVRERQLCTGGPPNSRPSHSSNPDGVGEQVESPVLELLLSCYPRDMPLPQLVGLSASPVVHFQKKERELVMLLLTLQCRLVGVVEEVADLKLHRPNPAITALSYLPLYEERVLQTALRRVLSHVFRRMEALVPENGARKKMEILRTTSVASPGFEACCNQFLTDVAMTEKFKKTLRFPPGSVLEKEVRTYLAAQTTGQHESTAHNGSGSAVPLPLLSSEEEIKMCADFILFGLQFIKAASKALIALQDESYEAMMRSFTQDFSHEEVERIRVGCGPITAIVLRPVILSVFQLMGSLRHQHPLALAEHSNETLSTQDTRSSYAGTTSASATTPVSTLSFSHAVSMGDALQAGRTLLPYGLRSRSTRVQVLMRVFTELAMVAVAMTHAPDDVLEHNLRVLVFVETRDAAASLMRIFSEYCPFAYKVLLPEVLLGQKNGKRVSDNYMTRAAQTALLEKFRCGETRLVFATTVAEEGIDVPDCHVVLYCHRHTELRNIVQSCGRLRMKNTLFLTLSNLLNGHPRLGFIMSAIHHTGKMLQRMSSRCRADAWCLENDELLLGGSVNDNANGTQSCGSSGFFPVTLPVNPNEASRLTTQDSTLLARQRSILLDLQRAHRTEVFCIHSRDLMGEVVSFVQVTVMMSVSAGGGGHDTPVSSLSAGLGRPQSRWDHISGTASGGLIKAAQKAFVEFCKDAQQKGYLTTEGKIPLLARAGGGGGGGAAAGVGSSSSAAASPFTGVVASWDAGLAALRVQRSYAKTATPSVVFLGRFLCLCSRKTWPPSVLEYFFKGRAGVMAMYNDDLWTSRIEPQTVLREELRAVDAPPARFHLPKIGNAALSEARRCGAGLSSAAAESDSVSEVGSYTFSNAYSSTTPTNSQDSRNWYRAVHQRLNENPAGEPSTRDAEFAEVEFLLPMSVVDAVQGYALPHSPRASQSPLSDADAFAGAQDARCSDGSSNISQQHSPVASPASSCSWRASAIGATERTFSTGAGCGVTECDVELRTTDKTGKEKSTPMRRVCIRYQGAHASKIISVEGLRWLGVTVVYGVDEDEMKGLLSTCRQVGTLE